MGKKRLRPRKKDGKITFDIVVREGNERIFSRDGALFKDLDKVLEMLGKKL